MPSGTIHPNLHINEDICAEVLDRAFRGGKDDKEKAVLMLTTMNNTQRQMIRTPYKVRYGKDLEEELKKNLKGDLENLALSLINTATKEDVVQLHKAVKGLGTNEKVLTEIIVSRTNDELHSIRNTFLANYKRTLEDAVISDTSGYYQKILVVLMRGERDQSIHTDSFKVRQAVETLAKPIEKKLIGSGGDKVEKYLPLCTESFHSLQRIFDEYHKKTGDTLDKTIDKELSGDYHSVISSIYRITTQGVSRFFADLIHDFIKAHKEDDLIRILVSRSEIDLADIKDVYLQTYQKSLVEDIKEGCKGATQQALLSLVKGNKSFSN